MRKSKLNVIQSTTPPKSSFLDSLDESTLTDLLSQYGKTAFYVLCALIALALVVYRLSSGYTAHSEREYIQTAQTFAAFEKGNTEKKENALKDLTAQLIAIPELQAAYGGAIAQTLLSRGQTTEAAPFVTATLKRTQTDKLPYYNAFGANSFLIAEGKYQEALDKTLTLQQQMLDSVKTGKKSETVGDYLFAFNLVRSALLYQQLGQKQNELGVWKEWKEYANLGTNPNQNPEFSPQAFQKLNQQISIGNVSLLDYIRVREESLTTQG